MYCFVFYTKYLRSFLLFAVLGLVNVVQLSLHFELRGHMQHLSDCHSSIGTLRQTQNNSHCTQLASRMVHLLSHSVERTLQVLLWISIFYKFIINDFWFRQHSPPGCLRVL